MTDRPTPAQLPERPNLRFLKDRAKAMVKAGEAATLAKAQFALAKHHGFASWPKLKTAVVNASKQYDMETPDRPPLHTRTDWHGVKLLGHIGIDVMRLAKADRLDVARMMIDDFVAERGTSPLFAPDDAGRTPFELWASSGRSELVGFLEKHGVEWDAFSASVWGRVDVLEKLRAKQSESFGERRLGRTPLHDALRHGHVDAARWLAENIGYDVTEPGYVRAATFSHDDAAVRLAVELGAPVDEGEQTALQHQCKHARTACVQTLLDLGADPNLRQPADGRTALHLAAATGIAKKLLHLLLNAGADPSLQDDAGDTPVDLAKQAKRQTSARALHQWAAEHDE